MSDSESSPTSSRSTLKRVAWWSGGLLGGLAVLVLVAALVLPRLFTSEQLKGYVIPPLEDATGRTVEIDAIGLRVLPFPAVRVDGFRLANDERFDTEPAVSARSLNVDLALWPLLVAKIQPKAIALVDPVVRYDVAPDGTTNFDTIGAEQDSADADEGAPLAGIPVSDFRATGAQVHYTDRSTGTTVRLDFDAQLSARPEGTAVTSQGNVDLRSVRAVLPSVALDTLTLQDATVDYDVRAALQEGQIDVRKVALETAPLSLSANGSLANMGTTPTVDLSVETGDTDLAEIAAFAPAATIQGLNPSGSVQMDATLRGPLPDSADALDALTLQGTGRLRNVGADYEERAALRDVQGTLAFSLDSVAVRELDGTLLDASIAGHVAVHDPLGEPRVDLRIATGPLSLETLATFAPEDAIQGVNPQGTVQLDASVTGPLPGDDSGLEQLAADGTGTLSGVGVDYNEAPLLRDVSTPLSFSNASVTLEEIEGTLLEEPLEGSLTLRNPMGAAEVNGRLSGTANLARLASLAGDESGVQGRAEYEVRFAGPLDTPGALQPTGEVELSEISVPSESLREPLNVASANVELTGTGLSMERSTMESGSQRVSLEVTVQDLFPLSRGLSDTNPAMSVDATLAAERLDLVALQPAPEGDAHSQITYSSLVAAHLSGSKVKGSDPQTIAEERYGDIELPPYAITAQAEIDTLLNDPQRYEDLSMDIEVQNRRLEVRNLTALLYGGDLSGSLTLDQSGNGTAGNVPPSNRVLMASTGPTPSPKRPASSNLRYDIQLEDARTADLLDDWTTLGRLVTGTLDLNVNGDSPLSEGLLPQAEAFTAAGRSLVVNGGLATETGLAKTLQSVVGVQIPSLTSLKQLGGPFTIRNGAFQVDEWSISGRGLNGTLGGAFGLNGSLDLTMKAELPLSALQRGSMLGGDGGGGALTNVLNTLMKQKDGSDDTLPVQLRIGGSMRNPDINFLNRDAVRASIRKMAQDAGLLNRLQDLFNPNQDDP